MRPPHRPRPGSWLEDPRRRGHLESEARRQLPDLAYRRHQRRCGPVDTWRATVDPNGYPARVVTAEFERRYPSHVRVYADGSTESPHRYPDRGRTHLCMWYPSDPADQRWSVNDGLLALFGLATHHLFKESWWRETGEWLGEQAPHGEPDNATPPGGSPMRRQATEVPT